MITVRNIVKIILVVNIMLNMSPSYAVGAIGWHWYNYETTVKKPQKHHKKRKVLTASQQLTVLRKAVREAKAKAILYPTESNLRSYIMLQNYVVQNAVSFTRVWQKTLLDNPSLDYSVLHPTENNAQQIVYAEQDKKEQHAISYLAKRYGLFFFYRGSNPLDQKLAPTITSFAREYKVSLIPISVDGTLLAALPGSKKDKGQAKALGIKYFPALILVDPKRGKVKPINYGFIAQDELRKRFLDVATNFKEVV